MMVRFKINKCKCTSILHLSNTINIRTSINLSMLHKTNISRNTSKITTPHNNHTLREGMVETSEAEEEEDLAEEEVRLHAITVNNRVTMLEISWNLQRHVHTIRDRTIMWSNVSS